MCFVLIFFFLGNLFNLDQELLIGQGEDIRDGGGFIVQAETGQQQQESRRGGASLVSRALAKLARRLADKFDETHHQALTHTLTAELPL